MAAMEGYLLKQGHVMKNWQRRYFRLDAATSALEYFTDHHLASRKGRISVAMSDIKLGEEIGSIGEGVASAADTRRFVFRLIEHGSNIAYYMCAELPEGPGASREYRAAWVRALRASSAKPIPSTSPSFDVDAPQFQVAGDTASALNELTFTASVTNGRAVDKSEAYEVTCRASILVENSSDGETVEECTCDWVLWKRRSDWHELDRQLRALVSLKHVSFPSDHVAPSAFSSLFSSPASLDHQVTATVQAFDRYLQQLLALDVVADFTSDGSRLVLGFLEYEEHAANLPISQPSAPPAAAHRHKARTKGKPEHHFTTDTREASRVDDDVDLLHDASLDVRARVAKVGRKLLVDAISA